MDSLVYNQKGERVGKVTLPEHVFGVPWNSDLVHQVVVSESANLRTPIAHTKERGEVRGGGRKPWRQKGTGRARHGSIRSPLWSGGGVTFGPRKEKDYKKKVNKKMKKKALYTVLSRKLKDGELLFVDGMHFDKPAAGQAKVVLEQLSTVPGFEMILAKRKNSALVTLPGKDVSVEKSFSNFGNITVLGWRNLNPSSVLTSKYLVITHPQEAVAFLASKMETNRISA